MDYSIKKFDVYHKIARTKALSVQEANDKLSCSFVTRSTDIKNAFHEYEQHYNKIVSEENCAPGEPIQQRILSLRFFLNKQNLVKTDSRKMFIGTHGKTQAAKNINNLRRLALQELEEDKKEFEQATPLNLKPVISFKTPQKKEDNNKEIISSTFIKTLRNITKDLSETDKKIWNNSLYFVPKDESFHNIDEGKTINDIILSHAFNDKLSVLNKLKLWKETFNDPQKQKFANEIME